MTHGTATGYAKHRAREELVELANRYGDQVVGDAVFSIWPELKRVPCDDAAVERVAAKLAEIQGYHVGPLDIDRRSAEALLRAAGETS